MLLTTVVSDKLISNLKSGVIKDYLEKVLPDVLSFFWCVILALIIFFVGKKVIKWIVGLIEKGMNRRRLETGVVQFVRSLLLIVLYIALGLVIFNLFGIATSSIAAAVATLGLTAGLSLQGALSNFAGGVLILLLHPFVVGDYIIEDGHKNEGTVKEISIFYTKLATVDNKIVVIPNGALANSSLTNVTKSNTRLMDLVFSISYESDIKTAKDVLYKLAESESRRIDNTEVKVFVKELADSAVILGLRFTVKTDEYWPVRFDILEKAKYDLETAGVVIAYNQLDVHIDNK
ncbi:MAG: mechanosensitive ion channel family protein [Lachnospiraceae bacterium]|nr:mechanosensitive ion channel family protein [Lachnospiraceae bacterium]